MSKKIEIKKKSEVFFQGMEFGMKTELEAIIKLLQNRLDFLNTKDEEKPLGESKK